MGSQNGAVVGYYGNRFVLPTGKAENNSTGFTAACAAFFLSYPILSLSTIAIVSFCVGYYGFNYFCPEKEIPNLESDSLNNIIVASNKTINEPLLEVEIYTSIASNEIVNLSTNPVVASSGGLFIVCASSAYVSNAYFNSIFTYIINIHCSVVYFMQS